MGYHVRVPALPSNSHVNVLTMFSFLASSPTYPLLNASLSSLSYSHCTRLWELVFLATFSCRKGWFFLGNLGDWGLDGWSGVD